LDENYVLKKQQLTINVTHCRKDRLNHHYFAKASYWNIEARYGNTRLSCLYRPSLSPENRV